MDTRKFFMTGALIVVTALSLLGVLIGNSCYSEWRVRRNLAEATEALEAEQKEKNAKLGRKLARKIVVNGLRISLLTQDQPDDAALELAEKLGLAELVPSTDPEIEAMIQALVDTGYEKGLTGRERAEKHDRLSEQLLGEYLAKHRTRRPPPAKPRRPNDRG